MIGPVEGEFEGGAIEDVKVGEDDEILEAGPDMDAASNPKPTAADEMDENTKVDELDAAGGLDEAANEDDEGGGNCEELELVVFA